MEFCNIISTLSVFFLVQCEFLQCSEFRRQVVTHLPCLKQLEVDSYITNGIIQSRASGPSDTLHYLYSTIGAPTIFVAITPPTADMSVNCTLLPSAIDTLKFNNETITFSSKPLYVYSLVLTRLIEYNDVKDSANLADYTSNSSDVLSHDLSKLNWTIDAAGIINNTFTFRTHGDSDTLRFNNNGSLALAVSVKSADGRNSLLPSLLFNANITQVDLVLDNVVIAFRNSRFAVEMQSLVSTWKAEDHGYIKKYRSIDDEYSPGVFEWVNWITDDPEHCKGSNVSYVQWKPICYVYPDRAMANETTAVYYNRNILNRTHDFAGEASIAMAYFYELLLDDKALVTSTNVSFGLSQDKFYANTNYTVWSFSVGYGTPPSEQISVMLILIISIGLGLPFLLMIVGSIGLCAYKCRRNRRAGFAPLPTNYGAIQ